MSNFLADLKNDNNWQQVYRDSKSVTYDAAGGYTALPAFEIPITFDKALIAVRTNSQGAKFTWRFSGVLSQRMQLGGGATPLPVASLSYNRLRINRSTLLHFPTYDTDYELLFEPYYWIKHIDLTIWEYTGVYTEFTNNLIQEIQTIQLPNIEAKLDDISNYG